MESHNEKVTLHEKVTLRDARKFQQLTLKEVSERINVPMGTLRRYELSPGRTPLHIMMKLIRLYKIHISKLSF